MVTQDKMIESLTKSKSTIETQQSVIWQKVNDYENNLSI
jgi:hypothetical protein